MAAVTAALGRAFAKSGSDVTDTGSGDITIPASTRSEWDEFFSSGLFSVVLSAFVEEAEAEAAMDGKEEEEEKKGLMQSLVQELGE